MSKTLVELVREKRAELLQPANDIVTAAEAEQRDLTAAEFDQAAAITGSDAVKAIDARIATLTALEVSNAAASTVLPQRGGAIIRTEARTYSAEAARRDGRNFLADLANAKFNYDTDAQQRLAQHMAEERVERPGIESRAVATSAFAGLVVPQYLTDLVAPTRRAGRPFADICTKHPLPAAGMTVNISRITTASTAAVQTENAAASETNMDDTLLSPAVLTAAGQQTASLQAVDRGTGVDTTILGDLLGAVNTLVDSTLITAGSTGLDAYTNAAATKVTYTDASPTAAELWPKLLNAVSNVQTGYYGGISHLIMHPRRFWWLASQVGTTFPFLNTTGAGVQQGGSINGTGYGQGASGVLAGIPVIVDANCAITLGVGAEDRIYAVTAEECHLWEDDVVFIKAEQTAAASLGVLFVTYKYFAYTHGRYASAHAQIEGTGLTTPTF